MVFAIFQVKQCLCTIFHFFFQVSRHIPCPTRWFSHFLSWSVFLPLSRSCSVHFSFFTYFNVCRHIPGYTMFVPLFPRLFVCLFVFSPHSRSYIVYFSFFSMFLSHISFSKMCISQFPRFSIFSPNSNPKVSISHFSHSSLFFAKFQVLQCVFLIVNFFQCFSIYSRSSRVYFLFFHVFHCFSPYSIIYSVCLIFQVFHCFHHTPGPTLCNSHFPH